jgi:polysaccharide transporter, PST family
VTAGSRSRLAARGSLVTLSGQVGRFVLQAVSVFVLARLLAPDDFGLMAMVLAVAGIATVIGDAGLSLAALASRDLDDDQRSALFWLNAAVGVATAGVLILLAPWLALMFERPALAGLTYAVAPSFALVGLSAQFRTHINRELRFVALVVVDVASHALALAFAIVLALSGAGVWSLAGQYVATAGFTFVGSVSAARWWPRWPRNWTTTWPLLRFGSHSLGAQVLNYLSINVPAILLGRVAGPTELGYYNRAYALFALPMTQLAGPLTRVALPMIATRREEAALQAVLLRAHVLLCYTIVAGFAVLAALAQPVVLVLLGEGWAPSVPIFRILAIAGAFQALAYVYYWAYLATGRTRRQLLVAMPGRLLMIGGAFAVAPLGGVGMAVLIAAGMVVLWLSNSVVGVRGLGIDPWPLLVTTARVIMVFTACSAATVLVDVTLLASEAALLRLIVGAAAWALTLALAALLFHGVRRDLLTVLRFVRPAA